MRAKDEETIYWGYFYNISSFNWDFIIPRQQRRPTHFYLCFSTTTTCFQVHALHRVKLCRCVEGGGTLYRKTRFQLPMGVRQLGHSLSRSLGRHVVHMSTCPHGQVTISRGWS